MSVSLALSLIPLLEAIFAKGGIEAALASLSFTQWATIGVQAAASAPAGLKFLESLHPALAQFASDIEKSGPGIAATKLCETLQQRLTANGNEAIELQPGAGSES